MLELSLRLFVRRHLMTKKQKHLTLEDRIDIQTGISQQETFRSIAEKMGKDPSTISKEIKRNRIMHPTSVKSDCTDCPLLKKAPYVCNNCPKKRTDCGFNRYLYYAKKAQEQYKTMLRESREGIPLNKESFYQMDKVLTLGIQKKQSIYHIIQTHNLPVSKATVYRHAKLGYLTAKPIDGQVQGTQKIQKSSYSQRAENWADLPRFPRVTRNR